MMRYFRCVITGLIAWLILSASSAFAQSPVVQSQQVVKLADSTGHLVSFTNPLTVAIGGINFLGFKIVFSPTDPVLALVGTNTSTFTVGGVSANGSILNVGDTTSTGTSTLSVGGGTSSGEASVFINTLSGFGNQLTLGQAGGAGTNWINLFQTVAGAGSANICYFNHTGDNFILVQATPPTGSRTFTYPDADCNPIQPVASATSNEWVQYVDGSGVQHLSQPSFDNISSGTVHDSGRQNTSTVITVTGSSAGHYYWSMPEEGSSYKKVLISIHALTDAGGTITFPVAFTYNPGIGINTTGLIILALTTTTLTLPASVAADGVITVEGM